MAQLNIDSSSMYELGPFFAYCSVPINYIGLIIRNAREKPVPSRPEAGRYAPARLASAIMRRMMRPSTAMPFSITSSELFV